MLGAATAPVPDSGTFTAGADGVFVEDEGIDVTAGAEGAFVVDAGGALAVGAAPDELEFAGVFDSFFPQPAKSPAPRTTIMAVSFSRCMFMLSLNNKLGC